jgi:hypothetical protein
MATDPNIILGVQPLQLPNPMQVQQSANEIYRMQLMQQQAEQNKAAQQREMMIRSLAQQPGNIDPETGMPTKNYFTQLSTIDPERALDAQNKVAQIEAKQQELKVGKIHEKAAEWEIDDKQMGKLKEVITNSMARYDDLRSKGVSKTEAEQIVSQEKRAAYGKLFKEGHFSEEQQQLLQGPFTEEGGKLFLAAAPQYKAYLENQKLSKEATTAGDPEFVKDLKARGYKEGSPEWNRAMDAYIARKDAPPHVSVNSGDERAKPPANFRWIDDKDKAKGVEPIPHGPADPGSKAHKDVLVADARANYAVLSKQYSDQQTAWLGMSKEDRKTNPDMKPKAPPTFEKYVDEYISKADAGAPHPASSAAPPAKTEAAPAKKEETEKPVPARFSSDPAMKGNKLGAKTDKGYEVKDAKGKLLGYYN